MKKISRRNFLKVTAAGAVGAATLSLTAAAPKITEQLLVPLLPLVPRARATIWRLLTPVKTPKSFCGTTVAARPASCWSRP